MIIAQISDSHISAGKPLRTEQLAACVSRINALSRAPDVIVHTGDIAHDGTLEEYRTAADVLSQLCAPLYVIPGNRDKRAAMIDVFAPRHCPGLQGGFMQYAVDDYPVRLIFLDTLKLDDKKGELCGRRLSHLDDMLQGGGVKPIAIFMHHPPYEAYAKDPFQFEPWERVAQVERLLRHKQLKTPQIAGLFCGHVHRETSGLVADIPASTMASIAVDLRFGEYCAEAADLPLFHLHEFSEDGSYTTQRIAAPPV